MLSWLLLKVMLCPTMHLIIMASLTQQLCLCLCCFVTWKWPGVHITILIWFSQEHQFVSWCSCIHIYLEARRVLYLLGMGVRNRLLEYSSLQMNSVDGQANSLSTFLFICCCFICSFKLFAMVRID